MGKYHRGGKNKHYIKLYTKIVSGNTHSCPKIILLDPLIKLKHKFLTAIIQRHTSVCTSNLYVYKTKNYSVIASFLKAVV